MFSFYLFIQAAAVEQGQPQAPAQQASWRDSLRERVSQCVPSRETAFFACGVVGAYLLMNNLGDTTQPTCGLTPPPLEFCPRNASALNRGIVPSNPFFENFFSLNALNGVLTLVSATYSHALSFLNTLSGTKEDQSVSVVLTNEQIDHAFKAYRRSFGDETFSKFQEILRKWVGRRNGVKGSDLENMLRKFFFNQQSFNEFRQLVHFSLNPLVSSNPFLEFTNVNDFLMEKMRLDIEQVLAPEAISNYWRNCLVFMVNGIFDIRCIQTEKWGFTPRAHSEFGYSNELLYYVLGPDLALNVRYLQAIGHPVAGLALAVPPYCSTACQVSTQIAYFMVCGFFGCMSGLGILWVNLFFSSGKKESRYFASQSLKRLKSASLSSSEKTVIEQLQKWYRQNYFESEGDIMTFLNFCAQFYEKLDRTIKEHSFWIDFYSKFFGDHGEIRLTQKELEVFIDQFINRYPEFEAFKIQIKNFYIESADDSQVLKEESVRRFYEKLLELKKRRVKGISQKVRAICADSGIGDDVKDVAKKFQAFSFNTYVELEGCVEKLITLGKVCRSDQAKAFLEDSEKKRTALQNFYTKFSNTDKFTSAELNMFVANLPSPFKGLGDEELKNLAAVIFKTMIVNRKLEVLIAKMRKEFEEPTVRDFMVIFFLNWKSIVGFSVGASLAYYYYFSEEDPLKPPPNLIIELFASRGKSGNDAFSQLDYQRNSLPGLL